LATTGVGYSALADAAAMPSGAIAETFPRGHSGAISAVTLLNTGRITLSAPFWLPPNALCTNLVVPSAAQAAVTPTNQWFVLVDMARNVLRKSVDDLANAWNANTPKPLALSSTYTAPALGIAVMLGVMVKAATVPSLHGFAYNATQNIAPVPGGSSSTGQTTPALCPDPVGAISASPGNFYGYVT
jgi:hypothetical protein